jgi:hypothetical protein
MATPSVRDDEHQKIVHAPRGKIGCQRRVSRKMASMYCKAGLSSNVGNPDSLTTASIRE